MSVQSTQAMLRRALDLHQSGRLGEAERLYGEVIVCHLSDDPPHDLACLQLVVKPKVCHAVNIRRLLRDAPDHYEL